MPRIQISQEAARALKVAAAMQDKRPHALMEELIFAATSPHDPIKIAPAAIEKEPEKMKGGTFSDQERDQIKTLHREGLSAGKIATRLNRHKSAVSYAIQAMKKRGEICE